MTRASVLQHSAEVQQEQASASWWSTRTREAWKSTMAEHVFFDDSKLMIYFFSSILRTWLPWTYVKKKTRDSSGCFISCEMASLLQDSTGKVFPHSKSSHLLPLLRFRFLHFSFEIPSIQTGTKPGGVVFQSRPLNFASPPSIA